MFYDDKVAEATFCAVFHFYELHNKVSLPGVLKQSAEEWLKTKTRVSRVHDTVVPSCPQRLQHFSDTKIQTVKTVIAESHANSVCKQAHRINSGSSHPAEIYTPDYDI